ncbi:MAG: hypothetical protein KF859_11890 [Phycisphaeraceae bacterium]|nr:hypothetical protein [Phycisphaeraceae bacterium]
MPAYPGQDVPGEGHDNPMIIDVRVDCEVEFPSGISPALLFPNTIVETEPPPDEEPGPLILCEYADPAPICAGGTRTAEHLSPPTPSYQGFGWFQGSRPELVVDDSTSSDPADDAATPDRLRIVLGARRVVDFSLVAGSSPEVFVGVNHEQGVVVRVNGSSTEPETYEYYNTNGVVWSFFGYYLGSGGTWVNPHGAKGQFWKSVNKDGSGSAFYTGHPTNPATALTSGFVQDGNPTARASTCYDGVGRRWVYSYIAPNSYPLLSEIDIQEYISSEWVSVHSVAFTYYDEVVTGQGREGDLKFITVTKPLSSGGSSVEHTYFRYRTDAGFQHLLKFRVDPEGVRRAGISNLDAMSDNDLKTYSSRYFEFDSAGRVSLVKTGGDCGCGGGDGEYTFTSRSTNSSFNQGSHGYLADGSRPAGDWASTRWASRIVATFPDGMRQTMYFDEFGWVLGIVRSDAANPSAPFDPAESTLWITKIDRDGYGRPVRVYTPEAVDSSQYDHTDGTIVVRTGAGLVKTTNYYSASPNYLLGAVASRGVREGKNGSEVLLEEFTYLNPATSDSGKDFGSTNPARLAKPLPTLRKFYREVGVADETSYSYTFHSGSSSWAPKSVQTTLPSLGGGDTSGPASVTRKSYLDVHGRTVFSEDGNGVLTFTHYEPTGLTSKFIQDPKTSTDSDATAAATAFGVSLSGTGLHYSTEYAYDSQGRVILTMLPGARAVALHYTKLSDGRLVSLSVPYYDGTNHDGPVTYSVTNLAGKVEANATIGLPSGTTTTAMSGWINSSTADVISAVQVGAVKQLTVNLYNGGGAKVTESRLFNTIPSSYSGATSGQYEVTTYGYEPGGKVRRIVDPTGTITYTNRDALGRITERLVGTDDTGFAGGMTGGSNNMVTVETLTYDGDDIGNSRVTSRTLKADGGTNRTTSYTYDFRGRLVLQVNPAAPHAAFKYNNAGNLLASGGYSSSPGVADPTSTTTNRVSLSETVYNTRGQVRETKRHNITQSTGASAESLSQYAWYDGAGRVRKYRGEQITKTTYDALGRATHRYILAADNDSSHADALTVAGDTVLEEYQTLYEDTAQSGTVQMTVEISRHPYDDSTTGALDAVGDAIGVVAVASGSFKGRAQITSYYYDHLDRQTAAVQLGTNGGSNYTRSSDSTVGTRSPTRLITSLEYNPDGTVGATYDPKNIKAVTEYDAAGRTKKTIANYTDGTPGGGTNGDQDQVVEYAYTNGLMTALTAKMPSSGDDQTTAYTYGVIQSGTLPSAITSNRLLRQVTYPDSASGSDIVRYAYNRLGQQTGVIDQAGNQIDTAYDAAGREASRAVSTLASGFDGGVRRIEMGYLPRGMVETVTQFDAASSGSVTDQVLYEYDGWGNTLRFHQDVDSTMNSSGVSSSGRGSFTVEYAHSKSAPSGGVSGIRRTGATYKTAGSGFTTIGYGYGASNSIDDLMNRVQTVTTGSSPVTVASYAYLGGGHLVGTTLDQPGLSTAVFTESGGTHTYGSLDAFNRPTRWAWERVGAFYDVGIEYDENSNPTATIDHVHVRQGSGKRLFDVVYSIDGLNRVIKADEGHSTGTPRAVESGYRTRNELWNNLSLTGNWGNRQLDANGDGSFTGEADRDEPSAYNAFNKANEWTARRVQKAGSDRDEYTYTYDAVGNITGESLTSYRGMAMGAGGRTFEYDAFGRLVRVRAVFYPFEGEDRLTQYRYNGLGFRIMWQYDADLNAELDNSDRYYFMYDDRWRIVGAFRNQDASPKESFVYHAAGLGGRGGSSYIDSVILRERDADEPWTSASDGALEERRFYCQNWRADVVAVTRSDGAPWEFVRYSAYGEPTVYPLADVNRDGVVNLDDLTAFGMGTTTGDFAATPDGEPDLDFDGDIGSSADIALFMDSYDANTGQSGKGRVSSAEVGNRKGYAGYEWDHVIAMSHVRHRVYWAEIGRWTRRDPIGYVPDRNLYAYVEARSILRTDPQGLEPALSPKDDKNFPKDFVDRSIQFWLDFLGVPSDGRSACEARLNCIIKAIAYIESRYGTGAGKTADTDPMQVGNPIDAACKNIGKNPSTEKGMRPIRRGTAPGISWKDMPTKATDGGGGGDRDGPGKQGPVLPLPYPSTGHDDPSFDPNTSYFWGTIWYMYSYQAQTGKGAHNICNGSNKDLIDGAVKYNGGGDEHYGNKVRAALAGMGGSCGEMAQ